MLVRDHAAASECAAPAHRLNLQLAILKTDTATAFVSDLASRLGNRVQITTDGHRAYVEAIETAFGMEVDFSILQKSMVRCWKTKPAILPQSASELMCAMSVQIPLATQHKSK